MAKNNNLSDFTKDIADAIREKKGTSDLINPQDFSSEIANIKTDPTLQEKTVTQNGEVVADSGYDGLSKVKVEVPTSKNTFEQYLVNYVDLGNDEYELQITDYVEGGEGRTVLIGTYENKEDATVQNLFIMDAEV